MENTRINLNENLMENIIENARDLAYKADYDFDRKAFEWNMSEWAKNKAHLYNVLKTSQDWDNNNLAIVKNITIERTMNKDNASDMLYYFVRNSAINNYIGSTTRHILQECFCFYEEGNKIKTKKGDTTDSLVNEYDNTCSIKDYIEKIYFNYSTNTVFNVLLKLLKIKNGSSFTKAFRKIATTLGLDHNKKVDMDYWFVQEVREVDENDNWTGNMCRNLNFEQFYAQFSNMLKPKTFKYKLVISINPIDYITQSYGDGWSSCHAFNPYWDNNYRGCNKGATLTMLTDPSSVIAYVLDEEEDNVDLSMKRKVARQTLYVSDEHNYILQNIVYPTKDYSLSKVIRKTLQDLLQPNYKNWAKEECIDTYLVDIDTSEYRGYNDFEYKAIEVSFMEDSKNATLTIGSEAKTIDDYYSFVEDNESVCSNNEKEYCEYCNEYHDLDDMRYIPHYDRYFCDWEIENEMYWCEDVEDYRFESDCWYDDYTGYHYSDEVDYEEVYNYGLVNQHDLEYSGDFFYCDNCGRWFNFCDSELHDIDYNNYCDECYEEYMENIEEDEE